MTGEIVTVVGANGAVDPIPRRADGEPLTGWEVRRSADGRELLLSGPDGSLARYDESTGVSREPDQSAAPASDEVGHDGVRLPNPEDRQLTDEPSGRAG